jgi:hypothetical protein
MSVGFKDEAGNGSPLATVKKSSLLEKTFDHVVGKFVGKNNKYFNDKGHSDWRRNPNR